MELDIPNMKVGDYLQLPQGKWDINPEAKAAYQAAQSYAANSTAEPQPQFEIRNEPGFHAKLVRIR